MNYVEWDTDLDLHSAQQEDCLRVLEIVDDVVKVVSLSFSKCSTK